MGDTSIEWTDKTWNPVTGCSKVSPGCKFCYAERLWPKVSAAEAKREGLPSSRPFTQVRCHPERLRAPLEWRAPQKVFVNSMSDLFHEQVPEDFIAEIFGVMAVCGAGEHDGDRDPSENGRFGAKWNSKTMRWHSWKGPHTFQVLTKRPERMLALLTSSRFRTKIASAAYRHAHDQRDAGYLAHQIDGRPEYARCYQPGRMWPLSNVWLGVSVEDQETADQRIPLLLQTPARVRFLSCEPLLGPIDLRQAWLFAGFPQHITRDGRAIGGARNLHWIISGGESGPKARPSKVEWFEALRDQCAAAAVPFFMKQITERGKKMSIETWPPGLKVREFPQ